MVPEYGLEIAARSVEEEHAVVGYLVGNVVGYLVGRGVGERVGLDVLL